jgi:Uncharacterised nucleotidyltransferase
LQTLRFIPGVLTNEYRLLLICARKILTTQQLGEACSAIDGGLDWDLLGRHAENHGLSPLLYWHLHRNFPLAVPARLDQRLKCVFENNVRHNLLLSATLLNILEALRAAGTRALAYKGPALATSLYGNITLREMSDLDILIDRASFPAAREVLAGLGCQPAFVHTRKQEEARLRCDCECEFSTSDRKVWVDLHWQITAPHLPQRFSFDELWHRRRILTLGRKPIPTFSAEDTALVLAVHGGKHLWQRLSWLADFAESLRQNLDWQALRLRARDARAERMLLLALALAEDVIQVEIPSEFAAAIRDDDVVQTIAAAVARKLFEDKEDKNDAEPNGSRWLALLQLADSRWDGIRSAARFALGSGPREWQAVRLPDSLFAFYPLLRIAGLLRNAPSLFFRGRGASRGSG